MKVFSFILLFLAFSITVKAQLKNGNYSVATYNTLFGDKVVRKGEFPNANVKFKVQDGKCLYVTVDGYPFYSWMIDKINTKPEGTFYHLYDIRDGREQVLCCVYDDEISRTLSKDCILVYIFWTEKSIDKLFLVRDE